MTLAQANGTAARQRKIIINDDPTAYPIFVNWEAGLMLRRTRSMFFPAGNFITVSGQSEQTDLYHGAAYKFFDELDQFLKTHPDYYLDLTADGVPLRGSLLTWIDEFFQAPESFLDRTFGSFENAVIAYQLLPQTKRIHLKAFGVTAGKESAVPQNHGEFNAYKFWEYKYWRTDVSPDQTYQPL